MPTTGILACSKESKRCFVLTYAPNFLLPCYKTVNVVKELRDDEVCSCIYLGLQVDKFLLLVLLSVRVAVGVGYSITLLRIVLGRASR